MGATKKHFYTEHQLEMADVFKALGHPARIAIMEKLIEGEDYNCSDLKHFIGLAQSTISRHLKELFVVGLVGYKVVGSSAYYAVNNVIVKSTAKYLYQISHYSGKMNDLTNVYFKPLMKHNLPYFLRV